MWTDLLARYRAYAEEVTASAEEEFVSEVEEV